MRVKDIFVSFFLHRNQIKSNDYLAACTYYHKWLTRTDYDVTDDRFDK